MVKKNAGTPAAAKKAAAATNKTSAATAAKFKAGQKKKQGK